MIGFKFILKKGIIAKSFNISLRHCILYSFFFILCSFVSSAQVTSSVDSTSITIGEQITYKIQVETDTTSLVIFPEGQTFSPLEMIESYGIDTIKKNDRYQLIKKYGLTQFDSGRYTIPPQKIVLGDQTFITDSLKVEVNNVLIDTTKQGLYEIKPIIEVNKNASNWWKYLLGVILILGLITFLVYWFVWRKKPLTEEEKIALLPPYDRAKLALKKLDESHYLEHSELKSYYSELTLIIRQYLDEKVYDHSLESTTDQLIARLQLLKEGNQIDLSNETIRNIENILKRADLVKFAKSAPGKELALLDRNTIDSEIDHVKEVLPEPSEEEKLLDEKYREELERKKKRRNLMATITVGFILIVLTFVAFSMKYGFGYIKDTIMGNDSLELLEGDWVTSEYGVPPVKISTPKVLKRMEMPIPEAYEASITSKSFGYGTLLDAFSVAVNSSVYTKPPEDGIDVEKAIEESVKEMEAQGAKDIVILNDKFATPNGAEGVKTYGDLKHDTVDKGNYDEAEYVMLHFVSENVLQQIIITYPKNDDYADQIVERILESVELKPDAK